MMKNFCIVTNRLKDTGLKLTSVVCKCLDAHGCTYSLLAAYNTPEEAAAAYAAVSDKTDCCMVLGGDGTIIQTARALAARDIPILGINLGTLGFLSIVEQDEIGKALETLLAGEFSIEERIFADVELDRADGSSYRTSAINDVVIKSHGMSRTITIETRVNNAHVSTYTGDGVIVATPTGSTGYNLSAGGPVVTPEARLLVITPVCPHSLNSRSIVVSESDIIRLTLESGRKVMPDDALATIDGQEAFPMSVGDTITVSRSARTAKLVRLRDRSFFSVLYRKLGE